MAAMPMLTFSLQWAVQVDVRHRKALPRHRVARCVRRALLRPAHITVRIVGEAEGLALNQAYRGRAYATNVLTFAYATEPDAQADVVLCAPVVAKEARALGLSLAAHYAHLLVHGTLHAQGFDHEDDTQAQEMEAHESQVMLALGHADPYRRSHRRAAVRLG